MLITSCEVIHGHLNPGDLSALYGRYIDFDHEFIRKMSGVRLWDSHPNTLHGRPLHPLIGELQAQISSPRPGVEVSSLLRIPDCAHGSVICYKRLSQQFIRQKCSMWITVVPGKTRNMM